MAIPKIVGAQRDFSYGEVDEAFKRADDSPVRKAGLRQMANSRLLNSNTVQNRPGRSALYPVTNGGIRTERITMSAGNVFDIQFAANRLKIINSAGSVVFNQTTQGNGALLPWASSSDIQSIVYAIVGLSIYICFGHSMRPQIVSWDGVTTWSIADFLELSVGSHKRTAFFRVAPQGVTLQPAGSVGSVVLTSSAPYFTAAMVGVRLRYINRQMLITSFNSSTSVNVTCEESLPGSQFIVFSSDPRNVFSIGDEVIGSVSGSKGIVSVISASNMFVQLLSENSTVVVSSSLPGGSSPLTTPNLSTSVFAFVVTDTIAGPGGSLGPISVSTILTPLASTIWDEEIMNPFRGFPASCFFDQFRLGFCDFPAIPGGISWSAINAPTDLDVGVGSSGMFEVAPDKVRVQHVVPGPESSEFVFTDKKIYYIPITPANPLQSGSVQFQLLSSDGAGKVQPRATQEVILYCNTAQNGMMAIIATGAYLRPFNTKRLSQYHSHLFKNIQAIAAPSVGTFLERYVYALNGDGSIAVGKYNPESLAGNEPVIGWGPWSGAGTVTWIASSSADVIFTSSYFGSPIVEILDDTQYLDSALLVNNLPAAFNPPGGKGPLWFIPSQTVTLIDQVTRMMGTYQIDANGNLIAQNLGGEDLTVASLVAGQPWTMTTEPFCPDAQPGTSVHQRMFKRRVSRMAVYVSNSTGFLLARLFSGPVGPNQPALGTIMNQRRITTWNQDDDPTKPPPQREETQRWRPLGRTFDPRVAIIKDTPGPLLIHEIGLEASI